MNYMQCTLTAFYLTHDQRACGDRQEMYNLNGDDVREVEDWFFRRYPKLARVIEGKKALRQAQDEREKGGSDDR